MNRPATLQDLKIAFDPWSVTDSVKVVQLVDDASAQSQLSAFWTRNPAPVETLHLHQEILAAYERRDVRLMDRSMNVCPWVAQWVAWRDVTIGGVQLKPFDVFMLYADENYDDVFVNEIRTVGRFMLEILN